MKEMVLPAKIFTLGFQSKIIRSKDGRIGFNHICKVGKL